MRSAATVCPRYRHAVELIGARWSGAIIESLLGGAGSYAAIRAAVPGLSDTMLAQRLRFLEGQGLLERCVHPTAPVRIEYALTPAGRALAPVIESVKAWAEEWLALPGPSRASMDAPAAR